MRIAFVNATHIWSGVKTWMLECASVLTDLGHEPVIYCRPGEFPEKARRMGLDVVECWFGPDLNPVTIGFFLKEFKKRKTDICICNISKDLRTGGVAARLLGIPVVHRLGDPMDVKNSCKTRLTMQFMNPSLLVCSEFCKHLSLFLYG